MSAIKRHVENRIENISKATGYSFSQLMEIYNEMIEDGEPLNSNTLDFIETVAREHDF